MCASRPGGHGVLSALLPRGGGAGCFAAHGHAALPARPAWDLRVLEHAALQHSGVLEMEGSLTRTQRNKAKPKSNPVDPNPEITGFL